MMQDTSCMSDVFGRDMQFHRAMNIRSRCYALCLKVLVCSPQGQNVTHLQPCLLLEALQLPAALSRRCLLLRQRPQRLRQHAAASTRRAHALQQVLHAQGSIV